MENRGGSKKETAFDVIKKRKKNMRAAMVMNQKANSIADLAAILLKQEEWGAKTAEQKLEGEYRRRNRVVDQLFSLALKYEQEGVEALRQSIEELRIEAEEAQAKSQNKEHKSKERRQFYQKALHKRREMEEKELEVSRMEYAARAVKEAKDWARMPARKRDHEADYWKSLAESAEENLQLLQQQRDLLAAGGAAPDTGSSSEQVQGEISALDKQKEKARFVYEATRLQKPWAQVAVEARARGFYEGEADVAEEQPSESGLPEEETQEATATTSTNPATEEDAHAEPKLGAREFLPEFPPSLDPVIASKLGQLIPRNMPAYQKFRADIEIARRAVFSTEGVTVKWANILDAEFAELWPEAVKHERLGFVRHAAPEPDSEGYQDITSFKLATSWKPEGVKLPTPEDDGAEPVAEGENVVDAAAAAREQEKERKKAIRNIKDELLWEVRGPRRAEWQIKQEKRKIANKIKVLAERAPKVDASTLPNEPAAQENAPSL